MRITRNHIIGASIITTAFIVGILIAAYPTKARVLAEARDNAERSQSLFDQSRLQYCEVYLAHLSSCYGGKQSSCNALTDIQPEYIDLYGVDAPTDCGANAAVLNVPLPGEELATGEIVESETGIPEQIITEQEDPNNPLFFGDEY